MRGRQQYVPGQTLEQYGNQWILTEPDAKWISPPAEPKDSEVGGMRSGIGAEKPVRVEDERVFIHFRIMQEFPALYCPVRA
jgi:hypothetical protein